MSDLRPPPAKIAELRQRRDEFSHHLARLRKERDFETREAEKIAQEATIREREARLAEVEADLAPIELVEKADDLERKQSWAAAITAWERLPALRPEAVEPAIEIARLREREQLGVRLREVSAAVMRRRHELGDALWSEVRASLQQIQTSGAADEEALLVVDEFLAGELDAERFGRDWGVLETRVEEKDRLGPQIREKENDRNQVEAEIRQLQATADPTPKPPRLFYSYAHEDEPLRDQLAKHLKLLERQGILSSWHDRALAPGTDWDKEISQQLLDADIILLLVSVDFLASDYVWGKELKIALERHQKGEARVIPIILRPCDWAHAPFAQLQALPRDARAVTTWPDRDQAFTEIAQALRDLATSLLRGGNGVAS